ncbi:DUF4097 family beta strand repeat-containing protein [Actinomadura miaoliensis]|uniref:DUF4097 family beta strand repeat-containing protein n=1 Tax=Actinomadura miaoliensis TaxID=430685 RepID=A0ABP7WLU8_9ACTN
MSTSHRRPLALTVGALLALAPLTGCGASADDVEPERRAFGPVGGRLTITKDRGDLDLRPADVDEIQVTRWFDRWALIGGKPAATWELRGDRLTLATDCGKLVGGCAVRYRILVPKNLALSVEGENGRISATGFAAALNIRSSNGAIRVTGATGPLDLRSDNGEVRSSSTRSERVSAAAQNGKVDLSFAAAPRQVTVTTDNGEVAIAVPRTTYKITTTTESGDVRAGVPVDPAAPRSLAVRTGSGAITLDTATGG